MEALLVQTWDSFFSSSQPLSWGCIISGPPVGPESYAVLLPVVCGPAAQQQA